jgi:N-acetylmuramoyl-L-alanine amidase
MTSAQPMASRSPSPAHSGGSGGTGSGPLHGKVVVLDPGHNGGNAAAAPVINKPIWNGRTSEACDTTGAQTAGGYTEARFNWNVARYVAADLRAKGATVILTRSSNTGVGPCVTRRTAIGNDAHANAALSIHADGGPTSGRGFAVLEPVADGPNDAIIGRSDTLGTDLRDAFAAGTGEPVSSYDGTNGLKSRDDLAGTNLSTVPKVFIECANMTNTADAALVTSDSWQQKAARAITAGLTAYLKAS